MDSESGLAQSLPASPVAHARLHPNKACLAWLVCRLGGAGERQGGAGQRPPAPLPTLGLPGGDKLLSRASSLAPAVATRSYAVFGKMNLAWARSSLACPPCVTPATSEIPSLGYKVITLS